MLTSLQKPSSWEWEQVREMWQAPHSEGPVAENVCASRGRERRLLTAASVDHGGALTWTQGQCHP